MECCFLFSKATGKLNNFSYLFPKKSAWEELRLLTFGSKFQTKL